MGKEREAFDSEGDCHSDPKRKSSVLSLSERLPGLRVCSRGISVSSTRLIR